MKKKVMVFLFFLVSIFRSCIADSTHACFFNFATSEEVVNMSTTQCFNEYMEQYELLGSLLLEKHNITSFQIYPYDNEQGYAFAPNNLSVGQLALSDEWMENPFCGVNSNNEISELLNSFFEETQHITENRCIVVRAPNKNFGKRISFIFSQPNNVFCVFEAIFFPSEKDAQNYAGEFFPQHKRWVFNVHPLGY